tara:strand:- start:4574 stop:5512 length:939 start_codon:yes stop_codon:yes gene_type:complete
MSEVINNNEISERLKAKAIEEGFAVAGIASIPGSSRINLRTKALERWLANNYHKDMKWMEAIRRKDIKMLLKNAKSVLSVGYNYLSETNTNEQHLKIGKFGHGDDYHKVIKKKLKTIGNWLDKEIPNCNWKVFVDSSPLLEKAWAEEAGLGWIGKNSNLINPKYGSWLLLGFLVIDIQLEKDKSSKINCGQCVKCIEKCPTNAIIEPFVINSGLCISYHTIENRDKNLPKHISQNLNGWIAGCDICQDVCPWNKSTPKNDSFEVKTKSWIKNLNSDAITWDEDEWSKNLKGSTLKRIKPWMWKRNIKAALKN